MIFIILFIARSQSFKVDKDVHIHLDFSSGKEGALGAQNRFESSVQNRWGSTTGRWLDGWCTYKGIGVPYGEYKIGWKLDEGECLKACKKKKGVTGCEYNSADHDCKYHTGAVSSASGHVPDKCYLLKKNQ